MEFLNMGNYGAYVWSCFALTFIVIALSEWLARIRHNRVYKDIEVRIKALEGNQ
tara:strand:- start:417 stop:578 length:162 start_codon:yes stop_codon:yes gene_type:complete